MALLCSSYVHLPALSLAMPHQFTSTPSKYVVRPLLPCAPPNYIADYLNKHTALAVPHPSHVAGHRSPYHALLPSPHQQCTCSASARSSAWACPSTRSNALRLRLRALRRLRLLLLVRRAGSRSRAYPAQPDSDSDSESSSNETSRRIARPSGANIQTVKDLFKALYPDSSEGDQGKKYTDFRSRLDLLCTQHLRPGVALSFQDEEKREKVYTKMTTEYPWLARIKAAGPWRLFAGKAPQLRCARHRQVDSEDHSAY
ncbi:hypothetical protein C8F04DRAFT_1282563 [Mycena alexandri]|uniref:Uncharacterized protein n=1 Tax=Mycena alexandri TaxID=1745969 RepID=A0AAD6RXK0_9AGAR|nr:hypothetical protein C8F04DRAFT_1282563 [Mycena alexandri]